MQGIPIEREEVLDTTSDTVKLIHQVNNKLDLDIDKIYDLDMSIEGFEVHGIIPNNIRSLLLL